MAEIDNTQSDGVIDLREKKEIPNGEQKEADVEDSKKDELSPSNGLTDDVLKNLNNSLLYNEVEPKLENVFRERAGMKPRFANQFICKNCGPGYDKSCIHHTCLSCSLQADGYNTMICQNCLRAMHIACMDLPLVDLFYRDWVCKKCVGNDVEGEKEVIKGYVTGKKSGILVGSSWKYRIHLSEIYLHRPIMAGIHGGSETPAYSIVLQGGYKNDIDNGDDFYYTGSGGRDDKKNHDCDQKLISGNLSLALTCDRKFTNDDTEALDWTKSSPVRVIRGYKLAKHFPDYAPRDGFRYDGIYKLVKYWKEKISSGHHVWRYHFRRDDNESAPWVEGRTFETKTNIQEVDLLAKSNENALLNLSNTATEKALRKITTTKLPKAKKPKTKFDPFDAENKKFKLTRPLKDLFKKDELNEALWRTISNRQFGSLKEFIKEVKKLLKCLICEDMVELAAPYTTACGHNFCKPCYRLFALKNKVHCPYCDCKKNIDRETLSSNTSEEENQMKNTKLVTQINTQLATALLSLKFAFEKLKESE